MVDPIRSFFERLDGYRIRRRATGSIRIELHDGDKTERWLVAVHGGDVSVSHRNAKADAVIRTSREAFEGMVTGRVNAMAAALRGVVSLKGDPGLLVLFQRALPGLVGDPLAAGAPSGAPS
jgi:putative sterol carrier protein